MTSGLLEMCLDINENPAIPPDLRFNIRPQPRHPPPIHVDPNIAPETANSMVAEYKHAVSTGQIPHLDLHVVRDQIEQRLAAQDAEPLDLLEASVPHPVSHASQTLPDEMLGQDPPGYMTAEHETDYLLRLDHKLGVDPFSLTGQGTKAVFEEEKHFADLTPREQERQVELLNPQSQHNWLKTHTKLHPPNADVDDNESLASHDTKPPRKRGNKNLAKQVGDRAVERAREGFSPSAASAGFGDEEEGSVLDDHPSSSRKRARDPDSTYRVKGGKSGGGGGNKGKRKRSGEDGGGGPGSGSSKKARTDGAVD